MLAAATRLAAISIEGESPEAVETRNAVELLRTAMAQQAAYSYSRNRVHLTPCQSRSYNRRVESSAVSSSERRRDPPHGNNPPLTHAQTLVDGARANRAVKAAVAQLGTHQ